MSSSGFVVEDGRSLYLKKEVNGILWFGQEKKILFSYNGGGGKMDCFMIYCMQTNEEMSFQMFQDARQCFILLVLKWDTSPRSDVFLSVWDFLDENGGYSHAIYSHSLSNPTNKSLIWKIVGEQEIQGICQSCFDSDHIIVSDTDVRIISYSKKSCLKVLNTSKQGFLHSATSFGFSRTFRSCLYFNCFGSEEDHIVLFDIEKGTPQRVWDTWYYAWSLLVRVDYQGDEILIFSGQGAKIELRNVTKNIPIHSFEARGWVDLKTLARCDRYAFAACTESEIVCFDTWKLLKKQDKDPRESYLEDVFSISPFSGSGVCNFAMLESLMTGGHPDLQLVASKGREVKFIRIPQYRDFMDIEDLEDSFLQQDLLDRVSVFRSTEEYLENCSFLTLEFPDRSFRRILAVLML